MNTGPGRHLFGWAVLVLAVALGAAPACSSGGGGSAGSAGSADSSDSAGSPTMGAGDAPPVGGQCIADQDCQCDDGRPGTTTCKGGTQACDCSACSSFDASTTKPFVACGGEPFGLWRATKVELESSQHLWTHTGVQGHPRTCPIAPVGDLAAPFFRVDLEDGGTASIVGQELQETFAVKQTCAVDEKINCDSQGLRSCYCKLDSCGIDTCTATVGKVEDDLLQQSVSTTWSRKDSTLTVDGVAAFGYCVTGDTMLLDEPDWGVTFTLERVQPSGTPAPCEARGKTDCTSDHTCHPLCAGGGECANADSEESCTNHVGCTWDLSQCGGFPIGYCDLAFYDVVPGCVFTKPPAP